MYKLNNPILFTFQNPIYNTGLTMAQSMSGISIFVTYNITTVITIFVFDNNYCGNIVVNSSNKTIDVAYYERIIKYNIETKLVVVLPLL